MALFRGAGDSVTTMPLADVGTYRSSRPLATGLIQLGLMTFAVIQEAPALFVKGAPVIGFTGFLSCVLSALKFPSRCASVGTMV